LGTRNIGMEKGRRWQLEDDDVDEDEKDIGGDRQEEAASAK